MTERDDITLLREFAATESEPAFATLVQRHLGLVYSTALRSVGSAHAAEEISQAVFIILARKAKSLGAKTILAGWLHQTTRLTAANFLRGEIRRQKREQEAYMQSTLNEPDANVWPQIAPLLDAALGKLGERDRNAIVLRFLENKSLAEVGAALGASEDAAKMRVNRALEKLRKIFSKRGMALSAALIAGAVSAGSVQAAPAGLAATISAVAITKGAAAGGSTLTLVKAALKIMAWTKAKTAAVVGVSILLAVGTTTVTLKEIQEHRTYSWQVSKLNLLDAPTLLGKTPPQVTIVRSKLNHSVDGTPFTYGDSEELVNGQIIVHTNQSKSIGLGVLVADIVKTAYEVNDRRTIFATPLPKGRYDFIENLPHGGFPALQTEIEKRFGIVGKWTLVETNVWTLERVRAEVEFKPATDLGVDALRSLCESLEGSLYGNIPLVDHTGLTNRYDFTFNWPMFNWSIRRTAGDDVFMQVLNKALREQLGLELVPSREPVEMLVVAKLK